MATEGEIALGFRDFRRYLETMTAAVVENELSYEQERGKPMPSRNHSVAQARLIIEFARDGRFEPMSELALSVAGDSYTPDLSVYEKSTFDWRKDVIRQSEMPLTVVEIFSPQQGYEQVMNKVRTYLANGVKSCWVVVPPLKTVTICLPDGTESVFHGGDAVDSATGLSANLDRVFA